MKALSSWIAPSAWVLGLWLTAMLFGLVTAELFA